MLTHDELISLSHVLRDERVLTVYIDGASEDPASRMPGACSSITP